jgi:C-terminal processing protease CtpA/Prc
VRSWRTTFCAGVAALASLAAQTAGEFQQDFDTAVRRIASSYAYFDIKATRWSDVAGLYGPDLGRVTTRDQFVNLLERLLDELYDPHAQLTVNLANSPRLVPSGADLWAAWEDGRATITQVRADSDAARAGIAANTVVVAIDGVPIADAVDARMGRSYLHSTGPARDWALRAVLAGRHNARRVLQLREARAVRTVELPAGDQFTETKPELEYREIGTGIGYIRLNDSLGNSVVVEQFDRALDVLRNTRGLILDLRNTPSGGNTGIARAILGRFVRGDQPYQKHVLPLEERSTGIRRSWLELVSPRGEFVYAKPVAVLVSRWTGSMGEGIAIGFDATRTGTVVGTPMAGLLGATMRVTLPRTGIGINLPTERLYHVDGTPREEFQPRVVVEAAPSQGGEDPFMAAALRVLAQGGF